MSQATDMRGGVRGLLQKSKEKDKGHLKPQESLGRPQTGSRRGLPPVREDSASKKRKDHNKNNKNMRGRTAEEDN